MKIVFFGNSNFSVPSFKRIIESFDVVGLVTAPDTFIGRGQNHIRINPVKELALAHDIPILQPQKLRNNQGFLEKLTEFKADLHVIVSYGKIIPANLITLPKYHTINLHASLLPKLRGAAPIQYALWQGLNETGNTVQFISEGMDEGDIINQSIIPVSTEDTYFSLEQKLSLDGAELLVSAIQQIFDHSNARIPQNHDQATYTKLIQKEDGAVFFSMNAEEIFDAFRALGAKPGLYLPLAMGNIKIHDCVLSNLEQSDKEGEILQISSEGIVVSCHEGTILLKTLQAPNKKAMPAQDFVNGYQFKLLSILK